jgi:uncharacterized membrane protein
MTPVTFTVLIGGSMIVTSIVWVFLVTITIQEYRRQTGRNKKAP